MEPNIKPVMNTLALALALLCALESYSKALCTETGDNSRAKNEEVLPHPFIQRSASGEIDTECFSSNVIHHLITPVLPSNYPEQREWQLYSLKPIEIEYTTELSKRLIGKTKDEIEKEFGAPVVKTGAEGYSAPTRQDSDHWIYFLGFETAMLDLEFQNNRCACTSVEGSYDKMFAAAKRRKEFIRAMSIGKSREEVSTTFPVASYFDLLKMKNVSPNLKYSRSLALQQQHNEPVNCPPINAADRSMYMDNMRRMALELTFLDNKCTGVNDFFELH